VIVIGHDNRRAATLTAAGRRRRSRVKHAIVRADVFDFPERLRLTPEPTEPSADAGNRSALEVDGEAARAPLAREVHRKQGDHQAGEQRGNQQRQPGAATAEV
jgi:hypothetical protein